MYRLDEAPERPQKLALRPQQPDRRARQSPPHASPPVVPRPTCDVREGSTRKSTLIIFTRTSSGHIRGPQRPYRWPVWAVNLSWGSAVLPRRDSFQRPSEYTQHFRAWIESVTLHLLHCHKQYTLSPLPPSPSTRVDRVPDDLQPGSKSKLYHKEKCFLKSY